MRVPLIGTGVAAALVCGWLAVLRYPQAERMNIITWLFVAFWVVTVGGTVLLRRLRSQTWESASAQIMSCCKTYGGHQGPDYICSYVYEVDGARQGGSFLIYHPNATEEQINTALVGTAVDVKYSPEDCTQSQIDANSINGWRVQ